MNAFQKHLPECVQTPRKFFFLCYGENVKRRAQQGFWAAPRFSPPATKMLHVSLSPEARHKIDEPFYVLVAAKKKKTF